MLLKTNKVLLHYANKVKEFDDKNNNLKTD